MPHALTRLAAALAVATALTGCKTNQPAAPSQQEETMQDIDQRAEAPSPAEEVSARQELEVEIPADGLKLAGTLSLPDGASAEAPVAAVVLVHGSGPQSRDEVVPGQLGMGFVEPVRVFADLAAHLQAKGYAVLRYDKRTCGPFNGCAENGYPTPPADVTPRHFVADAQAAGAWLADRPEVDGERVVYIGHSQGGSIGLEALDGGPFAGAVLLAANWRPIDALIAAQRDKTAELLRASGADEALVTQQLAPLDALIAQLERLRAGDEEVAPNFGGASRAFWQESFAIAEARAERLKALDHPVHLIFGGYDWNVPEVEAAGWRTHLEGVPEGVETSVVVLPEISHALNRISQPDFKKITPADLGRGVDAEVLEAVSEAVAKIAAK